MLSRRHQRELPVSDDRLHPLDGRSTWSMLAESRTNDGEDGRLRSATVTRSVVTNRLDDSDDTSDRRFRGRDTRRNLPGAHIVGRSQDGVVKAVTNDCSGNSTRQRDGDGTHDLISHELVVAFQRHRKLFQKFRSRSPQLRCQSDTLKSTMCYP